MKRKTLRVTPSLLHPVGAWDTGQIIAFSHKRFAETSLLHGRDLRHIRVIEGGEPAVYLEF